MTKELFELEEIRSNEVVFSSHSWVAHIFVLENSLWKVMLYKKGEILPPSLSVAYQKEDIDQRENNRLAPGGFSMPVFACKQDNGKVTLNTKTVKLVVRLPQFRLEWYIAKETEWAPLLQDRPTQCYNLDGMLGSGNYHYITRHREDLHFGLGERSGSVVKTNGRYRMCNVDCMGYDAKRSDPLYKHFPYYMVKAQNGFYALYYDTPEDCTLDLGREMDNYHGLYQYFHTDAAYLDYYVLAGEAMQDIVPYFARLGGKPAFSPKWSLGYLASSMGYTDAPNAQEMLYTFLEQCRQYNIPVSGFHLSSGYTMIGAKRYVFHWDTSRFPNPKQLFAAYTQNKVHLIANIKPCLLEDHPLYKKCMEEGLLIQNSAQEPQLSQFWDDMGSYLDFTNPDTQHFWKEQVTQKLLEYGIEATWNDNNEFEIWDKGALCRGLGTQKQAYRLKPAFTLAMLRSSWQAQTQHRPKTRPFLISRSGCLGMQRYVQTWSGDNYTCWETLRYNHKMGIGMSLSGIYNFGHDVGGFAGPKPTPELFVRWVQHGIFMPRFSIHSWNDDGSVNEAWMFPEHTETIRSLIVLRYRLLPYLYHLLYQSHTEYAPVVCPVFYYFPNEEEYESDLYMLGPNMLVANVFDQGRHTLPVRLPKEANWYNLWDGSFYLGGSIVECPAPLNRPAPVFMRAGSILPLNMAVQGFSTKEALDLSCTVFAPTEGTSSQSFFTDDGAGYGYQKGQCTLLQIDIQATPSEVTLAVTNSGRESLPCALPLQVIDVANRPVCLLQGNVPCTLKNESKEKTIWP